MLWLDSAFPLDKPTSAPGVRRGSCPGGDSSSPTHLRSTYPDGYVIFANAAIGEIGSTLIGSTGPFPTTPAPPCVEQCSSKPGQNTPECNGVAQNRCQQMAQYENKCKWNTCEVTTSRPRTTTETPSTTTDTPSTSSPTTTSPNSATTTFSLPSSTTSAGPTCSREAQMIACVTQGGVFECSLCTDEATSKACCLCRLEESSSTTTMTTTTTAASEPCKSWCKPHAALWEKKCKWKKCSGCPACNSRRLQENVFI